jgi:ankyrin repeat protein
MIKKIAIFLINISMLLSAMSKEETTKGDSKETLLLAAAKKGMADSLENFKVAGINLNGVYNGTTALHEAAKALSVKSVAILLKLDADPNILDKDNCTPLIRLLARFDRIEWCKDCSGCCSSAHVKNPKSKDMLSAEKIAKILLEHGASPDVGNVTQFSPIGRALMLGWQEMVQLLYTYKINLNDVYVQETGKKALAFVCKKWLQNTYCDCHSNLPRILINAGITIDDKDKNGETALFDACAYSKLSIMKMLLKAGANPNLKNNANQSVLEKAIAVGTKKHVKLLKKYGAML